ncbi:MAG: HAMP domain-containing sensor histidine kinase [Propionibacteriales bacterium]|nr:HAMP domain-containing sensor histidine kinase [Propionibacteriales bacterium]
MNHDQILIVLISAACAGGTALLGLAAVWFGLRRRSVRTLIGAVAVVAVAAVIAAMLGTAQAMFLSAHDFGVIVLVSVVAGVVGVAGAMLVGTAIARWSSSLTDEARRFGESGEFKNAPVGPAELQRLSEELARTSLKLQDSRRREDLLEESRRELISWVSHDLRTPLAGMRAMTEALEDGLADDPARYHRQIRSEVDRMVRMVDDLFELSRIHAGNLSLSLEPVLLGDVVSEALASADPVARAHGVRLGGAVDAGLEVIADPSELSRVVSNLVMNAIRHTPADGQVHVVGRAGGSGVELSVSDGCGGLAEDEMERVFDVAWQGSAARTPETGSSFGSGAGLGLAIVRGIVEAHRGTVSVANEVPGCRFLVSLPAG